MVLSQEARERIESLLEKHQSSLSNELPET